MSQPIKALIAGASGIIGHGVHRALDASDNTVRSLARHPIEGMETLCVDLTDPETTHRVVAEQAADTTHLFYAALSPDDDLAVEAERNAAMLENLLDALEAAGAPLTRVVIYQGFKIYGIHLGAKVPTPAREDDPSHLPPNLYQAQEAILTERARKADWDHVVLRPDLMIDGNVHGNPMNIAVVIGVFAALSRELGVPMRYPGTEAAYRVLMQFTDADLLGDVSAWAATTEGIAGEAFNITNGDVFRWERLWPEAAAHLGLDSASPVPIPMAQHMADKQAVWERIAHRHGLVEDRLDRLVGWGFGDFIFRTETDVISDVNKIYRYGFTPRCDSRERLLHALDRLRERRVIP
ncbi:SDR family oxidoreductase [Chromohalobacter sp. 296-RDG]|uniref:SDR family oxidoreductase n=1 Tax=Chromohalobacter sp. 296-RDG TaxID=2994062 RepID=UPI0024694487|nr:SDR family oxidoreductase [Chromohalobacter sp. 296-RDG]